MTSSTSWWRFWVRNGARTEAPARAIADQIRATFHDQRIARADYADLIGEMPGPGADDHIHAAAAVAVAPSILLTANTKDFPAAQLLELGVIVRHPADYFVDLLVAEPDATRAVVAFGSSRLCG